MSELTAAILSAAPPRPVDGWEIEVEIMRLDVAYAHAKDWGDQLACERYGAQMQALNWARSGSAFFAAATDGL